LQLAPFCTRADVVTAGLERVNPSLTAEVRLKSIMKGARFAYVAAIQERLTAVLLSIPKEAFADSFQKLYELCQQCVVKDGDYFECQ
jgi:hypothetical protein